MPARRLYNGAGGDGRRSVRRYTVEAFPGKISHVFRLFAYRLLNCRLFHRADVSESTIKLPPFCALYNSTKRSYHDNVNKNYCDQCVHLSTVAVLLYDLSSFPVVNDYGMTGELSRSSELPNSFLDGT